MDTKKLSLPPYGTQLSKLIQEKGKLHNDIFMFLGMGAWQAAKAFAPYQAVLMLPPGEMPKNYRWPVKGCDVLAILTSEIPAHTIKQTAHILLSSGAGIVRVLLPNGKMAAIYRRGAA